MLYTFLIWLLVAALFGAGLFDAVGMPSTQSSKRRMGATPGCNPFYGLRSRTTGSPLRTG